MTQLYTREGSYPAPVPYEITLSNGFIRTDPSSFTLEEITEAGYRMAPEPPEIDPLTETLDWDGVSQWVISAAPRPSGDGINAERDRRITEGASFLVTGVGHIPIQGRIQDQINLQSLLTKAMGAKAAGVVAPVLVIRDAENVIHNLTPDQMIELVTKGSAWVEDVMQISWAMKDGTAPFESGAPYDYTDDGYWP